MPIDKLIINSPYEVPKHYWSYDNSTKDFEIVEGRRPAGYYIAQLFEHNKNIPGEFVEIDQINQIRNKVDLWRKNGYLGVTSITKKLLNYWNNSYSNYNRFFYCQLEAIETLIWLTEASKAEKTGIIIKGDGGDFVRWCTKMATGTGKTVVMAMIIAWNVLNKVANVRDYRFSKNVFIVTPNLTIKKRLNVLKPFESENYYEEFDVVPSDLMQSLRKGNVFIKNWHQLYWETQDEIDQKIINGTIKTVDKRKYLEISDAAYLKNIFGDYKSINDVIVINDEAHHAWRNPDKIYIPEKKEFEEEATVWMRGLDRINKKIKIIKCFDLSATPFIPIKKRNAEESLYSWIVSDFGLNDSIESGLVKIPRAADEDEKYFHIYDDENIKNNLNDKSLSNTLLPDELINAYALLCDDWLKVKKELENSKNSIPPVMITIANLINTSDRIYNSFIDNTSALHGYFDEKFIIKVDSKSILKDEQHNKQNPLREIVDSVGKKGQPGEQIQHVISVEMLNEGWDAKNVSHIMGLRAFTSQLLCEQIIGRGLRRNSYDIGKDGLLNQETVEIMGIPFSFLPQEGVVPNQPVEPKVMVYVVPEKKKYEITWPNIERIEIRYKHVLDINWEKIKPLTLYPSEFITKMDLHAVIEGKYHKEIKKTLGLDNINKNTRIQTIIFKIAAQIFMLEGRNDWRGMKEDFLIQVVEIVDKFIRSGKIEIAEDLIDENRLRLNALYMLNMNKIVQHIWHQIRCNTIEYFEPVFNYESPTRSTGDMRTWYTSKDYYENKKSHINICVGDSNLELKIARLLDKSKKVVSFAKNDHLNFEIEYMYDGKLRKYIPNFLIKLTNGVTIILEVKGIKTRKDDAKLNFLDEWIKAVNGTNSFGQWCWEIIYSPKEILEILDKHCK